MKSLLYQTDATPFTVLASCGPGRQEVTRTIKKNGRLYNLVLRDKIVVDDIYLIMIKAIAFATAQGEPYSGQPPQRSVRDFLIKSNVFI